MADPRTDLAQASDESHRRTSLLSATLPTPQRTVPPPSNPGSQRGVALSEAVDVIETREAFLAAISHELRSPITALKTSAQLLVLQLGAPEEQTIDRARVLADIIDRQADKLTKLIGYLLDVSRSGSASVPVELQEVDLVALTEAAVASAQAETDRHEIRVVAPSSVVALVDPARIDQVLVNLLDNAIKYSPAGGLILAEVTRPDATTVQIAVTDHGVGVPTEQRDQMFDRFSRLHDPLARGLGIGLFLSRRLVQLHGGTLTAEFPPEGGTRIVVTLPVREG
jgi:signal transduction histidine kinase